MPSSLAMKDSPSKIARMPSSTASWYSACFPRTQPLIDASLFILLTTYDTLHYKYTHMFAESQGKANLEEIEVTIRNLPNDAKND
jgi:hypothetical protein